MVVLGSTQGHPSLSFSHPTLVLSTLCHTAGQEPRPHRTAVELDLHRCWIVAGGRGICVVYFRGNRCTGGGGVALLVFLGPFKVSVVSGFHVFPAPRTLSLLLCTPRAGSWAQLFVSSLLEPPRRPRDGGCGPLPRGEHICSRKAEAWC